jgi:hypothetical protein
MDKAKLKEKLKNDTRTKEEIFQELVTQMKELSKTPMSDGDAAAAARNLINFCSTLSTVAANNKP